MPTIPSHATSERSERARLAAYRLHATRDSREVTRPARQGFWRKFLDEVDPERVLPEAERNRRAQCALNAYMAALRLRRLS